MSGKLDFTVGSFSKVCFSGLNELQVVFGNVGEKLLQLLLFGCEATLVVRFFYKRSTGFDPLHITQQNRITGLWHLP